MSANLLLPMQIADKPEAQSPFDAEQRFAERHRIVLLEPDDLLRGVLVRTLLRLGCIVNLSRGLDQVLTLLREGGMDGAVVALDGEAHAAALLQDANGRNVPVVVLTYAAPAPDLRKRFATICFLRKPFDTRELLASLRLPEKAILRGDGKL